MGALFVLSEDATASIAEILTDVAERLAAYKVPERVLQVDSIPRNASTKVDHAAAAKLLDDHDQVVPGGDGSGHADSASAPAR